MTSENFELKVGQPVVRENTFGLKFGYYKETVSDKNGVWIRFTDRPIVKGKSYGVFVGSINNIRPATEQEIKENS